ncbi:MAG: hypothetical protein JNL11_08250 [Bdellovibrionaceae bacterium]|nr:hypothetical protein [Pseudobdellovibrionaceae bacterium]
MAKKLGYFFIFFTFVIVAAGFDMQKSMKQMKRSFKCVSGKSTLIDKCADDLQEIEILKSNLTACKGAAKAYYEVLFKEKMIPQTPNDGDISKAFDDIIEKMDVLKSAVVKKDAALKAKTVEEIQELIKQAHNKYRPEI